MARVIGRTGLKRFKRRKKLPYFENLESNLRQLVRKQKRMTIRRMMSLNHHLGLI